MSGVIYYLDGTKYAVRLLVSLWSLRKHYSGPVSILTPDTKPTNPALRLVDDWKRLDVSITAIARVPLKRNACYATKTMLHKYCVFEQFIYLDADTLVTGSIDDLWPNTDDLVVTKFANWITTGATMKGRVNRWRWLCPDLVERSLAAVDPAINTGVFAAKKGLQLLDAWHEMVLKNPIFIADETALQLLYHQAKYRLVDDRYNCSPVHGVQRDEVCIWHGHGTKHLRNPMGKLWVATLLECYKSNAGYCQEWLEKLIHPAERAAMK